MISGIGGSMVLPPKQPKSGSMEQDVITNIRDTPSFWILQIIPTTLNETLWPAVCATEMSKDSIHRSTKFKQEVLG